MQKHEFQPGRFAAAAKRSGLLPVVPRGVRAPRLSGRLRTVDYAVTIARVRVFRVRVRARAAVLEIDELPRHDEHVAGLEIDIFVELAVFDDG